MIRTTVVVLACFALIAPTAFAQTRSTPKRQATTTTEPITVTGTLIKITSEDGAAANYQPVKPSLFVRTVQTFRALMFSTDLVTL